MKIKVYASISPEQLIESGEKAGLSSDAVGYFSHCTEIELELHVDGENGVVCGCVVATKFD